MSALSNNEEDDPAAGMKSFEQAPSPSGGGISMLDSEEMVGLSDSFGLSIEVELAGEFQWDSLGDGYYSHEEMKELAEIVMSERREQRAMTTQNVRKWIK